MMHRTLLPRLTCAFFLVALLVIELTTVDSFAAEASVPGTWFDQDKYHLSSEPNGGESWYHNYVPWINGNHDPGEPASETTDWLPWKTLDDNSCWMASAANMIVHRQGTLRYHDWAYNDGIAGDFIDPWGDYGYATYTFDDGGKQHYCLEAEGLAWTVMAYDSSSPRFDWVDPVEYIATCLKTGPVGIGIYYEEEASSEAGPDGPGHALTIYAINTDNHTFTVADSDDDQGGNNFKTLSYTDKSGNGDIQIISNDYWNWNLRYICSFDDIGWWTAGSGSWHTASNWASAHAPTSGQDVYLTQSNVGTITINSSASAKNLYVAGPGSISLQTGGSLSTSNENIGESGIVTFFHSGGTNLVMGEMRLGCNSGATGAYGLSGSAHLSADSEYLGFNGTGNITQTGGTNSVDSLFIAYSPGSKGTYELSGTGFLSSSFSLVNFNHC